MGVPWNPEWESRIQQMADARARRMVEMLLADGSTLSTMTPGSIPSIASTGAAEMAQGNTDAAVAWTFFSTATGSWQPLNPPIALTINSGGRPVVVMAAGSVQPDTDEAALSFLIDGREVTNTPGGLALQSPIGAAWSPICIASMLPLSAGRHRIEVIGRRSANTGNILISTYLTRFTLMAWEV